MTRPTPDEFEWIDRLRPLTDGDPGALDLLDDAAILPSRAGCDLVVSKDALVEGVHFPHGESAEAVARRMLRTSLSDLAAKAAEPFGYLLTTAWPAGRGWDDRDAFIAGLARDGRAFGVSLLGGDTVSTTGPLVVEATVMGWVPAGGLIPRRGARPGDALVACGAIGDGLLGLLAVQGEIADEGGYLAGRYRLPEPLFGLRAALRGHVSAAADVSDGLLADAGHIARASGCGVDIDIEAMPLSPAAAVWVAAQADPMQARLSLAAGGDDYAIVCAVRRERVTPFLAEARRVTPLTAVVGGFRQGDGVGARAGRRPLPVARLGWRHGA